MKNNILLWLDDLRNPFENNWLSFSPIPPPYEVVWVKSYDAFVKWITDNGLPDGICYDHDLGKDVAIEKVKNGMSKRQARREKIGTKTGMDCAKWLVEYCLDNKLDIPKWNIQSANPVGAANIKGLLLSFEKHMNK